MKRPNGFPTLKPEKLKPGFFSIQCADLTLAKSPISDNFSVPFNTPLSIFLKMVRDSFSGKFPDGYDGVSLEKANVKLYMKDSEAYIVISYEDSEKCSLDLLGFQKECVNFVEVTRDEPTKRRSHKYLGLKNQRSMCYANSVLQVLFRIPEFRKMILSVPIPTDGSKDDTLVCKLQELFMKMETFTTLLSGNFGEDTVSAEALLRKYGGDQAVNTQSDAQEFFLRLIEKVEEEFESVFGLEFKGEFISGSFDVNITCECGNKASDVEKFRDFSLPLTDEEIFGCFLNYIFENKISEYKCPSCGNTSEVNKGMIVKKLPDTLVLHLMRFDKDGNKNMDSISISKNLSLADIFPDLEGCEYTLYSVVAHSGNAKSGHYISYAQNPDTSETWSCFDDTFVDETLGEPEIFDRDNFKCKDGFTPYLVIYRRDSAVVNSPSLDGDGVSDNTFKGFLNKEYESHIPLVVKLGDKVKAGYFKKTDTGRDIVDFAKKEFDIKQSDLKPRGINLESTIESAKVKPCSCVDIEKIDPPPPPPPQHLVFSSSSTSSSASSSVTNSMNAAINPPPVPNMYVKCKFTYIGEDTTMKEYETEILRSGSYGELYKSIANSLSMKPDAISICKLNEHNPVNPFSPFTSDMNSNNFLYSEDDKLYVGMRKDERRNPADYMEEALVNLGSIVNLPVTVNDGGKTREFTVEADYLMDTAKKIVDKVTLESGIPKDQIIIKRGMTPANLTELDKKFYPEKLINARLYQTVKLHVTRSVFSPEELKELRPPYHFAQTRLMEIDDSFNVKFTQISDFPIPENATVRDLEGNMRKLLTRSGVEIPDDKTILFCYGERNQKYFPKDIFSPDAKIPSGVWSYPNSDLVVFLCDKNPFSGPNPETLVFAKRLKRGTKIISPTGIILIGPDVSVSEATILYGSAIEVFPDEDINIDVALDNQRLIDNVSSSIKDGLEFKTCPPELNELLKDKFHGIKHFQMLIFRW